MPTTTALTMVNRMEDWLRLGSQSTAFTTDKARALLVALNSAKGEVLEMFDWDFDTRTDGVLTTIALRTYASGTGVTVLASGGTSLTIPGVNHVSTYTAGSSRSRFAITSDASFSQTHLILLTGAHSGSDDVYVTETAWPGTATTLGTTSAARLVTAEYVLPSTVRDVLSVMHEESDVALEFIAKDSQLDHIVPNPFTVTSDVPEVVFVGGTTTPTVATGGTPTSGIGLWLYPAPASAYTLRYTYRYRHAEFTATTDTIEAPKAIVDCIVDKAVAKCYRSAIANDPEMALRLEADVARRLVLLSGKSSPAPARRMTLRSHDAATSRSQFGSQPSNPRVFYTP